MNITSKTLMLNFENEVKLGQNGAIEATLVHQAMVFENEDGSIGIDIDFTDIENVKFMGMDIDSSYSGFKKFKEGMKELGIDVDKLMNEAEEDIVKKVDEEYLKSLYVK